QAQRPSGEEPPAVEPPDGPLSDDPPPVSPEVDIDEDPPGVVPLPSAEGEAAERLLARAEAAMTGIAAAAEQPEPLPLDQRHPLSVAIERDQFTLLAELRALVEAAQYDEA